MPRVDGLLGSQQCRLVALVLGGSCCFQRTRRLYTGVARTLPNMSTLNSSGTRSL